MDKSALAIPAMAKLGLAAVGAAGAASVGAAGAAWMGVVTEEITGLAGARAQADRAHREPVEG